MICPRCGSPTKVLRTATAAGEVRRRRECTSCGHRISTTERDDAAEHGIAAKARRALREAQTVIDELTATDSG